MTSVLVTVDTELSPAAHQRGASAEDNFANAILGRVADGDWGIGFQIRRLAQHNLKAVFFVEALSASVVGLDLLKHTIDPILSSGNEVQLHAHTEWLTWFSSDPVEGRRGRNMTNFSYEDQCRLLELGVENLVKAGAPQPIAFRAGNYGANNDTLRALAKLGIRYDTSYNAPYLGNPCNIVVDHPLLAPRLLDGVIEIPISVFVDYPNHLRPAQLCAVSSSEMKIVIAQSAMQRRATTIIVSHSFELLNRSRTRANKLVVERFEKLCQMLGEMRAEAPTRGFAELDQRNLTTPSACVTPLRSSIRRTAGRAVQQAISTALYG